MEKLYGRKLWTSKNYLLRGAFWDGFRQSAKWTAPAYILFFSWVILMSDTVWQALWALLMIAVSSVIIYLSWKRGV